MSKRRTIGENPLDFVVSENHLEAVVPDPMAAKESKPLIPDDSLLALDQRLEEMESAIKNLRIQVAEVRMELAEVKNQMFRDSWWIARLKEKLAVK